MSMFHWTPDLEVGDAVIDNQHRELFQRLEQLSRAVLEDRGSQEIPGLVEFLVEYVRTHFSDEEQLMIKYNFPGLLEQREAHAQFAAEVEKWRSQGASSGLTAEVMNKAGSWFREHVRGMDKQLADFIRSA